jgi:methyl-accepting chemotaxis protein
MKLTLAKKISLSFGCILAITVGLGGYASRNMQAAASNAANFNGQNIPTVALSTNIQRDLLKTMVALRTYSYTVDPNELATGRKYIADVQEHLKAVHAVAKRLGLNELESSAHAVDAKVLEFIQLTDESVSINAQLGAFKSAIDVASRDFMAAVKSLTEYNASNLVEQITDKEPTPKLLESEIKLEESRSMMDRSLSIGLTVWKAIAERNPDGFLATKNDFSIISANIIKMRRVTSDKENLDRLASIEKAANAYATNLESYRRYSAQQVETLHKSLTAANVVLAEADLVSNDSIQTMLSKSASTVVRLTATSRNLWIGLVVGLIVGVALTLFITRALTLPILRCVTEVEKLAKGDLTGSVGLHRSDELGTLAKAIDTCIGNLRQLMGSLTQSASDLQSSARTLTDTAHTQSAAAEETTVQANTVAAAGEELSVNSKSMSASATQITQSTSTVAAAMEEMSSSIQEVARNCAQESEIACKANTQSRETRVLMGKLDESARQIGKVVELINRIAEQTNLLALNATIEAASAGEAGRGFAVVAHEVKELARQSAAATEVIRKQVGLIQDNTSASIKSLEEVGNIIEQVSQISSSIAAAVEEQSATTSEIVGTIHGVSTASSTLSQNVHQTADGASQVAHNIAGVSAAAAEGARGAARVSTSATELMALSATLSQLVAKFKI